MPLTLDQTFASFADELRGIASSVWTDCVPNNIWRSTQIETEEFADQGLPYGVLEIDEWAMSLENDGSGMDNATFARGVNFWRVQGVTDGGEALEGSLLRLINRLMDPNLALTYSQVRTVESFDYRPEIGANRLFITKKFPIRAGMVRCLFWVGEEINA